MIHVNLITTKKKLIVNTQMKMRKESKQSTKKIIKPQWKRKKETV